MTEESKQIMSSMGGGGAHFGNGSSSNQNNNSNAVTTNTASSSTSKHHSAANKTVQSHGQSSNKQGQAGQQSQTKRQRKRENAARPSTGKPQNATSLKNISQAQPLAAGGQQQQQKKKGRRTTARPGEVGMHYKGSVENFNYLLGFQTNDDSDYQDPYHQGKGGRRRARGYSSYAPTFTKEQYMQAAFKFVVRPLRQTNSLSKAKSTGSESQIKAEEKRLRLAQEQESRYIQYLGDPGAIVEWKDVIEVIYTLPSALTSNEKTQCPICMEPAGFMVAPRISKCGHLFCYACLLQYLDFEKERAWKKCPLCKDPIYKHDIRKATLVLDQAESQETLSLERMPSDISQIELKFRLVTRNKSNIVSKHKVWLPSVDCSREEQNQAAAEETKTESHSLNTSMTIMEAQLPQVDQKEYAGTRVRIGTENYIRNLLSEDLDQLERDRKAKQAYNSEDQVFYLEEAIEFCHSQLAKSTGELTSLSGHTEDVQNDSESEAPDTFVDLQTLNKQRSLKKQHSVKETIIAENSDTCFYFYQVVNGENLFLHPLCYEILLRDRHLVRERQASEAATLESEVVELPPLISGRVVEMTGGGMSMEGHARDCDFLGHLPPAASYQLVELDLATSEPAASPEALNSFAKQLTSRQKARSQKEAKEKRYNDRVERTNTKKFDTMKQQVLGDAGFVQRPSKPVIRYLAQQQAIAEEEEKKAVPFESKEPIGFIGLDDDDDHGLERAFGNFQRKGQGGDSADDRGGGTSSEAAQATVAAANGSSIWAVGGLDQLKSQASGYRLDTALFERELQASKAERRQRLQSDASGGSGPSFVEAAAELGFGVQVNQSGGGGGGSRKKKKWKKM